MPCSLCPRNSVYHLCHPGVHRCPNQHGVPHDSLVGLREQRAANNLSARGKEILNPSLMLGREPTARKHEATLASLCPCPLWPLLELGTREKSKSRIDEADPAHRGCQVTSPPMGVLPISLTVSLCMTGGKAVLVSLRPSDGSRALYLTNDSS